MLTVQQILNKFILMYFLLNRCCTLFKISCFNAVFWMPCGIMSVEISFTVPMYSVWVYSVLMINICLFI